MIHKEKEGCLISFKLMSKLDDLMELANVDEELCGSQFWEITKREIKLVDPTKVKYDTKTKKWLIK